jgi:hypothetical protein
MDTRAMGPNGNGIAAVGVVDSAVRGGAGVPVRVGACGIEVLCVAGIEVPPVPGAGGRVSACMGVRTCAGVLAVALSGRVGAPGRAVAGAGTDARAEKSDDRRAAVDPSSGSAACRRRRPGGWSPGRYPVPSRTTGSPSIATSDGELCRPRPEATGESCRGVQRGSADRGRASDGGGRSDGGGSSDGGGTSRGVGRLDGGRTSRGVGRSDGGGGGTSRGVGWSGGRPRPDVNASRFLRSSGSGRMPARRFSAAS